MLPLDSNMLRRRVLSRQHDVGLYNPRSLHLLFVICYLNGEKQ